MGIEIAASTRRVRWDDAETRRSRIAVLEQRSIEAIDRVRKLVDVDPWRSGQGGEQLDGLAQHLDRAVNALMHGISSNQGGWSRTELVAACELAVELQRLRQRQEEERVRNRLMTLTAISENLNRPRGEASLEQLLQRATQDLCKACGFDRSMLFRVDGPLLVPESTHFVSAPVWADECHRHAVAHPIELAADGLETEMIRRRSPALMTHPMEDPRAWGPVVHKIETAGYVAVPIFADDRIIATLHADTHFSGRVVDALDRDATAAFAIGLGYALERAVLIDRLKRQRETVRMMVRATEESVTEFCDEEISLERRFAMPAAASSTSRPSRAAVPGPDLLAMLTRRELEVLQLLATGATNGAIADTLVISQGTVKSHVKNVLRKLNVSNRAEAVSRFMMMRAN